MAVYDTSFEMTHYGKGNITVVLFTTKEGLLLNCYWLLVIGKFQGLTCCVLKINVLDIFQRTLKNNPLVCYRRNRPQ